MSETSKSPLKIYQYKTCSTCQKALKYLDSKKIAYESFAIVESPPSLGELKIMLAHLKAQGGGLKNLFNTSGVQYRELKIAEKLKEGLTEAEALKLLASNGKLIKRPFVLTPTSGTVGFKPENWDKLLV